MILKEVETSGQQLDHLGLVASIIKRLKLIERIDAKVPVSKEKGAKVSIGQRVAVTTAHNSFLMLITGKVLLMF
ncbi:MAG: DUF4277 domain-containing protein [Legionella sp.]|nr:DUF4277 domain-containing protein [Legionella sp.]